jgi:hypothetical protein
MTSKRKWRWRAAGVLALVAAVAGTWGAFHATELRAKFAARKLASATTDEERAKWADTLIGHGEPGVKELIACLQSGQEPARAAAASALEKYLDTLPDGDPRAVRASAAVLDTFSAADDAGKRAVLRLVPAVLKRSGGAHALRCRVVVAEGLKLPDFEGRLTAVRLAIHPDIKLRTELLPLLGSPEPRLRGAALFAVAAPGDGESVVSDEELFRWLHDPDEGVRKICRDALVSRDRTDSEITLGRRLTHPDATERLKLLLDLRYHDDVADPEPWLERLSRDPEPAVRAGAARVAVELSVARTQSCPTWVGRIADADPHPTVRLVATYYRSRPVAAREPLRLIEGRE